MPSIKFLILNHSRFCKISTRFWIFLITHILFSEIREKAPATSKNENSRPHNSNDCNTYATKISLISLKSHFQLSDLEIPEIRVGTTRNVRNSKPEDSRRTWRLLHGGSVGRGRSRRNRMCSHWYRTDQSVQCPAPWHRLVAQYQSPAFHLASSVPGAIHKLSLVGLKRGDIEVSREFLIIKNYVSIVVIKATWLG